MCVEKRTTNPGDNNAKRKLKTILITNIFVYVCVRIYVRV